LLFNRLVLHRLKKWMLDGLTLGEFLRRYRFPDRFKEQHLFPMVAAIWSAPDIAAERFPRLTFAHFFDNHGLLNIHRHPQWSYVASGSHTHVKAILDQLQNSFLNSFFTIFFL
jgi:uncharacterized protein